MANKISLPFKWSAPEFEYYEKGSEWFTAIIVIFAAVFAAALILGNFLFGILALFSGITIALFGIKKPRILNYEINSQGVQIENKIYPYNIIESFWVHYDPPVVKTLSLKLKKTFVPRVKISLGGVDPNTARELLLKFVKEKPYDEPLIDHLIKIIRF